MPLTRKYTFYNSPVWLFELALPLLLGVNPVSTSSGVNPVRSGDGVRAGISFNRSRIRSLSRGLTIARRGREVGVCSI